jgi:ABC-type transporter Mla maintaining outer membrane lipid asymmetry ATPase subunit MlaF
MDEYLLEVRDFERTVYGRPVLRVSALTLRRGESLAVVGMPEAEAELFLHHLTGRFLPDAGEVRLFGTPTTEIRTEAEWFPYVRRIGLYDDRWPLLEDWPVEVSLLATLAMDWSTPVDERRYAEVRALAQRVGLRPADLERPMAEAGPAIRCRVHLARALAFSPDLLILFYPTERLDGAVAFELGRLVRRVCRGLTLLLFTRDESFAAWLCPRLVFIDPSTGVVREVRARFPGWERLRRWLRV